MIIATSNCPGKNQNWVGELTGKRNTNTDAERIMLVDRWKNRGMISYFQFTLRNGKGEEIIVAAGLGQTREACRFGGVLASVQLGLRL